MVERPPRPGAGARRVTCTSDWGCRDSDGVDQPPWRWGEDRRVPGDEVEGTSLGPGEGRLPRCFWGQSHTVTVPCPHGSRKTSALATLDAGQPRRLRSFLPEPPPTPMTPPGLPLRWHCSPSTVSFASLVQMSSKARPRHPPSCHYLVPLYSEYCSHQLGGHYFPGNSLCPGWFQPLLPGLSYHSGRVCTPPPSLHTRGPRVTPFVTWSPSPARADCVIWVQLARPPSASASSSVQGDKCSPHPPGGGRVTWMRQCV